LDVFWRTITEILLRPDAIEEWKKIAEERSIRLKVAIRK
jgi:hypothetical protein